MNITRSTAEIRAEMRGRVEASPLTEDDKRRGYRLVQYDHLGMDVEIIPNPTPMMDFSDINPDFSRKKWGLK